MATNVTELDSTYYWRSLDIIDFNKIQDLKVNMIGVGGLGSPTAICLAKMGVKDITVFDPDVVDNHNVPNQMYSVNDVGSYKVDAISNYCAGFGANVDGRKEEFISQSLSGLVIVSVDSMKARKQIWNSLKYNPNVPLAIDMRMGAEIGRIFTVNPVSREGIKFYEENLYDDAEAIDLACTAQAIIYNTFAAASFTCKIVKDFIMGGEIPREITLDMIMYSIYTR